ncbi:MAG: pantoate--beta-alanine ligase [Bacteroidia bacterium]
MIFSQTISSLKGVLDSQNLQNSKIGFVPTMGALHEGHLSLIRKAKEENDFVVCSIFVNPTQFNNANDLKAYPRTLETDMKLLAEQECDLLFFPSVHEMYPDSLQKESADDYGNFIHVLEGKHRPGHFDGVVTIVNKLFNLVQPNQVYFGQKDYQQCLVVKELIKRNHPNIIFHQCQVVREADGLAMSSRNIRLNEQERSAALLLSKALFQLQSSWNESSWLAAKQKSIEMIQLEPLLELEYFEIADRTSLETLQDFKKEAVCLVAVNCGSTRLIDNVLLA